MRCRFTHTVPSPSYPARRVLCSERVRDLPPAIRAGAGSPHEGIRPGDPMAPKSHVRTTRRRRNALDTAASLDVDAETLDEHLPSLVRLIEQDTFAADADPQI